MGAEKLDFHLSDGEFIVRSYECTKLFRLFAPATFGFLTVSNKRVVYHSTVRSQNEFRSVFSEIPLDDVAGLNISISATFNWVFFLIFLVTYSFLVNLIIDIFPAFLTGWAASIIYLIPYTLYFLYEKNFFSDEVKKQFRTNLQEIPGQMIEKVDQTFYNYFFKILFSLGLAFLTWNLATLMRIDLLGIGLKAVACFAIYQIAFGTTKSFILKISGKSPSNSGIVLPNDFISMLFGAEAGILQAIYVAPGRHAELIVTELGAMLTDIRQMGDLGIRKWMQ